MRTSVSSPRKFLYSCIWRSFSLCHRRTSKSNSVSAVDYDCADARKERTDTYTQDHWLTFVVIYIKVPMLDTILRSRGGELKNLPAD